MTAAVSEADEILKGLIIPPRPAAVVELQEELAGADPDVKRVERIMVGDPGLASALIKIANSPVFRRGGKVAGVGDAIKLMGVANTGKLVVSAALKRALDNPALSMERFWDTAGEVAAAGHLVARRLGCVSPDDAYTIGLFHDCGIPLLAQVKDNYKEVLGRANNQASSDITHAEDQRFHTDHAVVGYFACTSWRLPKAICRVVQLHHSADALKRGGGLNEHEQALLAVLKIAEQTSYLYHAEAGGTILAKREDRYNYEWDRFRPHVLERLGLAEAELDEMFADGLEMLEERI